MITRNKLHLKITAPSYVKSSIGNNAKSQQNRYILSSLQLQCIQINLTKHTKQNQNKVERKTKPNILCYLIQTCKSTGFILSDEDKKKRKKKV